MHRSSRAALAVSAAWLALSCRLGYEELVDLAGSAGRGAGASGGATGGTNSAAGTAGSTSDAGEAHGAAGVMAVVDGGAPSSGGNDSGGVDAIGGAGGVTAGSGGSGGAPAGCRVEAFDGHDYAFCDSGLSFTSAALDCTTSGMYPVRIDSADEQTWVHSQIPTADQDNNSTSVWRWIGGYDAGLTGDWRWGDGEQFWSGGLQGSAVGGLYNNWVNNHPLNTRGCAAMEARSGGWYAMPCTQARPYVCERY